MKITVLATPRSKFGPFTVVYDLARWPEGTRRNRGWEGASVVYEREATSDEIEEQRQSPRMLCFRNESWDQLAGDEARYGVDAESGRHGKKGCTPPAPRMLRLCWKKGVFHAERHHHARPFVGA
jgi:hypothetical protein